MKWQLGLKKGGMTGWVLPQSDLSSECMWAQWGEIHYLTSSITSHRQGEKVCFPHPPKGPAFLIRGRVGRNEGWVGVRRNVVTHIEQKCLSSGGRGPSGAGAVWGVAWRRAHGHTQHSAAAHDHMRLIRKRMHPANPSYAFVLTL